ncbi:hypothetical protein [Dyadobacter fermentans]|uniref:Outer membrane protein beta-barrel domain-containing protein n=1 Tax=Dyadobacter fermentans (strain ATCC 700827 / DSM 18053 / CIP 107007 / KCTC 52180 / NS114) TaxID=471854 RepID=C6VXC7_DYAFD|nr:hypothetical protein [Dyadobacter fermentans]ACT93270.1 hypothetical protein Dfer_2047 [Dyadobacter fermentans DSM 18053]
MFRFSTGKLFFTLLTLVSPACTIARAQQQAQQSAPSTAPAHSYPRMAGYVGILHPIVTFSSEGTVTNFDTYYIVGMPTGINIWKSPKIGFSAEFVPLVRAENGSSRMANFLFHPGILVTLAPGLTFAGRAAFETAGRYGFTPVLNKIVKKNKNSGYFVAVPVPFRFGNGHPASVTVGFQFGITF